MCIRDRRNIRHFSADGYSGPNFNRPGFTALLEESEAGRVETLVVKDLSRFGRNYLQVGYYTEVHFLILDGVRFASLFIVSRQTLVQSCDFDFFFLRHDFNLPSSCLLYTSRCV